MPRAKPRRQRGEGTIHQRPNGTYCGQLDLGTDVEGKRRRRTIYGRTQEEVLRKMRELRRQLDEHGDLPTSDTTVEKWLTYWLESIATKRLKPNTLRAYKTAVKQHIAPTIGKRPLSRLSPQHVRAMHDALTTRQPKPLSSTTALNAHRILSAALNDAVREGRVGRNVASLVRAPAKAVNDRRGLTSAAAITVMRAADGPMFTRWATAFLLGARQGECLGLRWSHVDLEAGLIDLEWALQRVSYTHGCDGNCRRTPRSCPQRTVAIPAGLRHELLSGNLVLLTPKTTKSRRVVPMPDALLVALKRHQETSKPNPYGLVWTTADGEPIDPHDDWKAWRGLLEKADVPHVTLHEARHTTASLLLDLNVPEAVISAILGHSSVVTTRGYAHVDTRLAREALNQLGGRLALPGAAVGA